MIYIEHPSLFSNDAGIISGFFFKIQATLHRDR